jgi:hypothetical protein
MESISESLSSVLVCDRHLTLLVELSEVGGHTDIENRVQLFAAGCCKEEIHDSVDLVLRVNLMGIESEFKVVEFVRVRLFAEDRGAVVIREGLGDGFVVILKIFPGGRDSGGRAFALP